MAKDKTIWVNNCDGLFFTAVGYSPSEKAWNKTMKSMGIKDEPYPLSNGRCTYFEKNEKNHRAIIVCLNPKDDHDTVEVLGLIVHEVVHVVQFLLRDAWGEINPSDELQAYLTQYFFQQVHEAFIKNNKNK